MKAVAGPRIAMELAELAAFGVKLFFVQLRGSRASPTSIAKRPISKGLYLP
jgi:hypothetical protein